MIENFIKAELQTLVDEINAHGDQLEINLYYWLSPTFRGTVKQINDNIIKYNEENHILKQFLNMSKCECTINGQCAKCEANEIIYGDVIGGEV